MKIDNLQEIYEYLVPNCIYQIWNNDPTLTVWMDERPQPTLEEIITAQSAMESINDDKVKNKLIKKINNDMYNYINDNCSLNLQSILNCSMSRYIYDVIRQIEPSKHEANAKLGLKFCNWVDDIVKHFINITKKIKDDIPLEPSDTNWKSLFDATKPSGLEKLKLM